MRLSYILFIAILLSFNATANDIKLTADEKVEWHQNQNKMVAVGNAVASKDDMTIKAKSMTASYEKINGKNAINNVHAIGNVQMFSPKTDAFGDELVYKLKEDLVILTGAPAKIKTEKETITAKDKIIYYPSLEKAIALGDVIATSQDNKIFADKMVALFEKNSKTQNLEINRLDIFDNVRIKTPQADVTADKGTYFPKTGIVELYDNVLINQNGNILKGDKAQTNLNTGVSKITAGKQNRVTGVFKETKKETNKYDK